MGIICNILLFVVILSVIVFIHELGHFTWAKIAGVYVYEFALGMGPKLWGKKIGETEYTLRLIPIGGFCQMAGEDLEADADEDVPKEKRLQSKTPLQRFLIMFFGPGNNFILAFIILLFIGLVWGGTTMNPVITKVNKDMPAAAVGLEKNDKIISINNQKVTTSDDVSLFLTVASKKDTTSITVIKENGSEETYSIRPKKVKEKGETNYYYGIEMQQKKTTGVVSSIKYSFQKMGSLFKQMYLTVKFLVTGKVSLSQLSGPVGIYSVVGEQSKAGLASILFLVAYLSVNVGFLNLIPLPAFDGGHILFIIIEVLKGSPVNPEVENKIHTIGMMFLMLLMLLVTANDIIRLF